MKLGKKGWLLLWVLLLLLGLALVAWTLKDVRFADLARVLSALGPWQLSALLAVNIAILFLFPLRWWLILRAQGHQVPYILLTRYRLVAFAMSYFTPGQHFGGEPLQVLYLRDKHKVPATTALASVTLDRVLELFANFAILVGGISIVLNSGVVADLPLAQTLPISIALLLLPALYLGAVRAGQLPLTTLTQRFKGSLAQGLRSAEKQLAALARKQPSLLLVGLLVASIVWTALIFEIWLSLIFLGLHLTGVELALVVVASRVALFAPTPGALGALEASQVLAMQSLGYAPEFGLALGLLIRARDIFFGLAGLLLGALTPR